MSVAARSWLEVEQPPHAGPRRDDLDARRHLRRTLVLTLALYAVLGATLSSAVPWWVLLVAVPWLYVRLALALHELLHARSADEVPAFHRLAMIFEAPLGVGFREHRQIHLDHHRYGGGAGDPERVQIEGTHLHALLTALATPERALVLWVRTCGLDAPLARQAALRLAAFCALVAMNPAVFAVYWLVLRASVGASGYVFHHLLHNRDGALGTYPLPFPPWLAATGRALCGEEAMLILERHRSHHLWPDVPVRALPALPTAFALPEGAVTPATLAEAFRAADLSAAPRARKRKARPQPGSSSAARA